MNEKIARQVEEMKKQTIGVEVEMNSITRNKAAKIAADFFGTGRYEDTARRNGYCTWSAWDGQGREWKFQKDVSIAGPDIEKCEMVTPILTYSDMDTLQELVRQLRHAGAKSREQWHSLRTFGTADRVRTTAETSITTAAATICLTSTQLSQRERWSSDFFNSTRRMQNAKADFTQDSSRATFSFASHSARWQRKYARQARNPSRTRIRNTQ